ncbi:multicopper oxidase family protein, partial [Stutzerimonas kirkiae]|uniref:multicopper oxidase family protein n=1 Tax=Stutzerimonas kirkiae TaxID=2211392 RepID=UPI0010384F8A
MALMDSPRRTPALGISLGIFALTLSPNGWAEGLALATVSDPPKLESRDRQASSPNLLSQPGGAHLQLRVQQTPGELYNPASGRREQVNLRSYQGPQVDPSTPFISPTIEVQPGETARISLSNELAADATCNREGGDINQPHCFNGTNLHAHGLWVSPAGNSDNVLLSINPGVQFEYEYNIPSDHPAGTFWYHTHLHGSTALQVSSGMAGALIVRGNRLPDGNSNGDLDTLLKPTATQPFRERLVVLQQIQYACRDQDNSIKRNPDKTYRCDPGDVGTIDDYDLFGPGEWATSGRYTSINGRVLPLFTEATSGQVERWRVIHGGVRDTISLQFRKLQSNELPATLDLATQRSLLQQQCAGKPLPQHRVAADGLTLAEVQTSEQTVYQPGYRWDTLMVFPEPGIYCVIDAATPAAASVDRNGLSPALLGFVQVAQGGSVQGDSRRYLTNALLEAAKANIPGQVAASVAKDLENGLKLTRFVPHPTIQDDELTGSQTLTFNIVNDPDGNGFRFEVNDQSFQPGRIDRSLTLGDVEEWTLNSRTVGHPFHIHVNPFQIVKILDPDGKDVSAPGAVDRQGEDIDTQYAGLKGVWKDTLWVKNLGGELK